MTRPSTSTLRLSPTPGNHTAETGLAGWGERIRTSELQKPRPSNSMHTPAPSPASRLAMQCPESAGRNAEDARKRAGRSPPGHRGQRQANPRRYMAHWRGWRSPDGTSMPNNRAVLRFRPAANDDRDSLRERWSLPETRQTIMTLSPSTVLGNHSNRQESRTLVCRESGRRNRI
jgi:hypothetical protein